MKKVIPDYYNDFQCIADKCMHNCCIGWEIDIDTRTLELYKSIEGDFSKRLKDGICDDGETAYFKLSHNERCPFLNSENLCDIIINLGDMALCQICSDHPRFRNFYDNVEELGIGLCCEAAGKLILNRKEKMKLITAKDDGNDFVSEEEEDFFDLRNQIFDILQNRKMTVDERIKELLERFSIPCIDVDTEEIKELYLSLIRLDEKWTEKIENMTVCNSYSSELEIPYEQLLIYFIYRHLCDGMYFYDIKERILFAVTGYHIIKNLTADGSVDDLVEIARMYSSEVEYCEENVEKLLDFAGRKMIK